MCLFDFFQGQVPGENGGGSASIPAREKCLEVCQKLTHFPSLRKGPFSNLEIRTGIDTVNSWEYSWETDSENGGKRIEILQGKISEKGG